MFAVSPVASASVAATRPLQIDAPERMASVTTYPVAIPVTFDPRATYALSTGTADAVLSLAGTHSLASDAVAQPFEHEGSSQDAGVETAPQTQRTGDTPAPIDGGSDVAAGSQVPGGHAATSVTALDLSIAERRIVRQAEDAAKWDAYLYSITHIDGNLMNAISFYLMCNDVHYRNFKAEHPSTDIHWINVDSKKIVSLWPKVTDQGLPPR